MRALSILLILSLVTPAVGRPLYKAPKGTRIQVQDKTYQGYTLEEVKVLLKMDVDLEFYDQAFPKLKLEIDSYKQIMKAREEELKSKDNQITLLQQDRVRLSAKWTEENRLRHECEEKPSFGSWLSWGAAGAATLVALVLGVVLVVKYKN